MRCRGFLAQALSITLIACVEGAVALGSAPEGERSQQPRTLPFCELHLRLWAKPISCPVGVPIAVYAELSNPHTLPVVWHGVFGWWGRSGRIHRTALPRLMLFSAYEQVEYKDQYRSTHPHLSRYHLLQPGVVRRTKTFVVYQGERAKAFLGRPGLVFLHAEMWDGQRPPTRVVSNTVSVELTAPEGRDADALKRLQAEGLVGLLRYRRPLPPDEAERAIGALRGFLAEFSQSVYTPYALSALAQCCLLRKQYSEAAGLFRELAQRHPGTSVAEDALFLLGECYRLSGQPALAAWAYREVLRRYPDTPAAADALETLTDVRAYPEMLFAEDRRLDREVSFPADQVLPLEKMLERASELAGVPLEVVRECRGPWRFPEAQRRPLRSFMADWASREKALWVPISSGGYRLEPDPDEKAGSRDDH